MVPYFLSHFQAIAAISDGWCPQRGFVSAADIQESQPHPVQLPKLGTLVLPGVKEVRNVLFLVAEGALLGLHCT